MNTGKIIIILIIISNGLQGFFCLFLTIRLYCQSLLEGPPGTDLLYILAGRPNFARPYEWAHQSTSLISSSLLLQQFSACLVRLIWIGFVMCGSWGAASMTCSLQLAAFLCNYCQDFSLYSYSASMWWIHVTVSIRPLLGKKLHFIL